MRMDLVRFTLRSSAKLFIAEVFHLSNKFQAWLEAKKKYRLSDVQIQMARELGMNPKKFGSLANHKQEPWKAPLPDFIEELYFKRFKKDRPDVITKLT